MNSQRMLMELKDFFALSGREKEMGGREVLWDIIKRIYPAATIDKVGNIVCTKKGKGNISYKCDINVDDNSNSIEKCNPSIMIIGHYDEYGLVVREIDEKGFIRLSTQGYIDEKRLLASQLLIHGKEIIPGICGAKPPHLLKAEDREKPINIENLLVDTGYSYEELNKIVSIGDPVSYTCDVHEMLGGNSAGRSLSTKSVILSLIHLIKKLPDIVVDYDINIVFALGRLNNFSGVYSALDEIEVDKVLFVESLAVNNGDSVKVGGGPCILKGPIFPKKVVDGLEEAAVRGNIKCQIVVKPSEYNSLSKIPQTYKNSMTACSILIPVRNFGGPYEIINIRDLENTGDLLSYYLQNKD